MGRAQPAQDSLAPSAQFELSVFTENIKLKLLTFWQINDQISRTVTLDEKWKYFHYY